MAFWTTSSYVTSYDHEDGAGGRVQMSFYKNRDKVVRARTLDYCSGMCNHMHEKKHVLCGHYMNGHIKQPMIRRLCLFGTEIFIVQFQFKYM
jgi:hypothetical protein